MENPNHKWRFLAGKIIYKWTIFHGYVKWPEGICVLFLGGEWMIWRRVNVPIKTWPGWGSETHLDGSPKWGCLNSANPKHVITWICDMHFETSWNGIKEKKRTQDWNNVLQRVCFPDAAWPTADSPFLYKPIAGLTSGNGSRLSSRMCWGNIS